MMFKRFFYYLLQIKALLIFGQRVYAHGNFEVANPGNVTIGEMCSINSGVFILGRCRINIGSRVTLSAKCMILDSGLDFGSGRRAHIDGFVVIEDDVWIGAGAIVLPGVTLGRGCVVGAGSVVTRSVAPNSLVAGNPAKVIRTLEVLDQGLESAAQ